MPRPPKWTFLLTDLQGNTVGELVGAPERSVTLPLNRVPTATFQVPLWHPLTDEILSMDTMLKVYRGSRLVFYGPNISIEETASGDAQSLAVTATGPAWRLSKRFIGRDKAGVSWNTDEATTSPIDLGDVARQVVFMANAEGYTGITIDSTVYQTSTSGRVGPWYLKNAAEAIAELSGSLASFDWEVEPFDTTETIGGIPTIGKFNVWNRPKGVQRPDAIFEYGTQRANVQAYNRTISREALLNRAVVSISGWPDGIKEGQGLIFQQDNTSIGAHGLLEEVVSDAGVTDDALRTAIAQEHLRYRKDPRQIVTFTPSLNASPQPFVDWEVGDWVRGRAVVRGTVRFDAMFRIWGASFKIDQNGNETLDLQLVQE